MYGFILHPFPQPQPATRHPTHRPPQRPLVGPVGGQVDEGVDDTVDEDQEHAGMVQGIGEIEYKTKVNQQKVNLICCPANDKRHTYYYESFDDVLLCT